MTHRSVARRVAYLSLIACTTAASPVFAQAADAGQGFWDTLINLLYGWPGLVIGVLFLIAGVYLWVKEGALLAVMTLMAGVVLFFTPAAAQYIQQSGADAVKNVAPSGRK